jgi:hypothetical protein
MKTASTSSRILYLKGGSPERMAPAMHPGPQATRWGWAKSGRTCAVLFSVYTGAMGRELTTPARARMFEEFRRRIMANNRPVSGENRAAWFEKLKASVGNVFGERPQEFKKPGLPAAMFKARVQLGEEDQERWAEIYLHMQQEWKQVFAPNPPYEMHTYAGFERGRMVYEFALLDGDQYLTGSVTVDRWEDPAGPPDRPRTPR